MGCAMSVSGQCYGSVGWQAPDKSDGAGTVAESAVIRELYRAGKLALSALVMGVAKPSDHVSAVNAGKVSLEALLAAGVDLHKAQTAYNRKHGDGSKARAQRAAMVAAPSTVELALIREATDAREREALAKLASARKAKRERDKAARGGRVLSGAELAAIAAQYGASVKA